MDSLPGPGDAAAVGARAPTWMPDRAAVEARIAAPRIAVQADGSLLIKTLGGDELPPLREEEAEQLAQAINEALTDRRARQPGGPSWSPGRAAGAPDTPDHGDHATAWAPQSQDGGREWLEAIFEQAVEIREITIHESFNPGALAKVAARLPDGSMKVLWEGTTPAEGEMVERAIPVPPGIRSDTIRIELETGRVPGWNEIDALEIVGVDGSRQWAREATASSYFGEGRNPRSGLVR